MKRHILPNPPNPDDAQYRNNIMGYNRALFQYLTDTKGRLETDSKVNDTPLDQNFTLGSYTLTTALAGTSTGADITNYVCSIVAAFQRKGVISPTKTIGNT